MKTIDEFGISNIPWKTESWQTADDAGFEITNVANEDICQLPIWTDRSKRIANARLIAAAPKLYEALEECERKLDAIEPYGNLLIKVRAALAKARGEEAES